MSALLDRMKDIMEKEGIKQKQVAAELGLYNSSFTDWSKGKGSPSVNALTKFADRFHVSLDYLVRGEEFSNVKRLDFSNPQDKELLEKFHMLTPELQTKLLGYIEGMLAVLPKEEDENKRISV